MVRSILVFALISMYVRFPCCRMMSYFGVLVLTGWNFLIAYSPTIGSNEGAKEHIS